MPAITQKLTGLWILVLMAAMWNGLAGYGGLVSVGQQAFIGVGAYATLYLTRAGVDGYTAMVVAIVVTAGIAFLTSFLVLRLRGGEFAIAMWVIAEVFRQLVSFDMSIGGGTGISLHGPRDHGTGAASDVHLLVGRSPPLLEGCSSCSCCCGAGMALPSRPSGMTSPLRPPWGSGCCPASASSSSSRALVAARQARRSWPTRCSSSRTRSSRSSGPR